MMFTEILFFVFRELNSNLSHLKKRRSLDNFHTKLAVFSTVFTITVCQIALISLS